MKKLKLFGTILCAMLLFVGFVNAEEYPNVEEATAENSLANGEKPTIEGAGTADVTVTVSNGEWHLLDDDPVLSRPTGYTWVGLKFTMPSGADEIKINGEGSYGETFTEYFGFNATELEEYTKKGEALVKTFKLTWKEDETNKTQNITLVVIPSEIVVKDYTEAVLAEVTHNIIVENSENGTVSAPETAIEGKEVTLTITPKEGYKLDTLKLVYKVDDEEKELELSEDNTFVMPAGDVTVTATFAKVAEKAGNPNTGDINLMIVLSMIAVATVGIVIAKKKIAAKAN